MKGMPSLCLAQAGLKEKSAREALSDRQEVDHLLLLRLTASLYPNMSFLLFGQCGA
jgi:hypothetical protein